MLSDLQLPFPPVVLALFQIAFIIHAIKNQKGYWIYLLIFFPGISALLYLILEIIPDPYSLPYYHKLHGLFSGGGKKKVSKKAAKEALRFVDTVENREILADAYMKEGDLEKAIEWYRKALEGVGADDAGVHFKLSQALYEAYDMEASLAQLQDLEALEESSYDARRLLLTGKVLEELGKDDEAFEAFRTATHKSAGLEANYQYIRLAKKLNKDIDIKEAVEDANYKFKQMLSKYKGPEREWIRKIRREF